MAAMDQGLRRSDVEPWGEGVLPKPGFSMTRPKGRARRAASPGRPAREGHPAAFAVVTPLDETS
jgi:hypothetical protein